MQEIIKLENLSKIYGKKGTTLAALDNINLTVNKGEYISIVGNSGSGKSTLMNIVGFLDKQTSGKYYFCGEEASKLNQSRLAKIRANNIGFIFQGFNLIPSLTAVENVELPLVYRGMKKEERNKLALEALERVGLSHRLDHLPKQMSGGQQQRVAIARAVAARPPIILADEPTGNLDSHSGVEVMKILHELHEEGRTVILITHDNDIANEAQRVIRIQDGQIISDIINK